MIKSGKPTYKHNNYKNKTEKNVKNIDIGKLTLEKVEYFKPVKTNYPDFGKEIIKRKNYHTVIKVLEKNNKNNLLNSSSYIDKNEAEKEYFSKLFNSLIENNFDNSIFTNYHNPVIENTYENLTEVKSNYLKHISKSNKKERKKTKIIQLSYNNGENIDYFYIKGENRENIVHKFTIDKDYIKYKCKFYPEEYSDKGYKFVFYDTRNDNRKYIFYTNKKKKDRYEEEIRNFFFNDLIEKSNVKFHIPVIDLSRTLYKSNNSLNFVIKKFGKVKSYTPLKNKKNHIQNSKDKRKKYSYVKMLEKQKHNNKKISKLFFNQ